VIEHLLLDADGVLQHVGGRGWRDEILARLGERSDAFVAAVAEVEAPALRGEEDFPGPLAGVLDRFGLDVDADEVYAALWESITVDETVLGIAREVRDGGTRVHLATNQHPRRAALMQRTLGYDEVTDTGFYSCELGVAKPDVAFFATVLARLGASPEEVAFVDDSPANVGAARGLGIAAVRWHLDDGADVLRSRLVDVGVRLPG
jgi:putative hydrolase of the HAD superfamily